MSHTLKQKNVESLGEFGLIREIKKWIPQAKAIVQGIGDDTAVFRASPNRYQLLAIDTLVEDVDFRKGKATPQEIGWKALAINLSDIAAMGGIPKAAVVSLTLPKKTEVRFVKGFYEGIQKLAKRFHVAVVGGDLSRGLKISSSVAVLGESHPKWTVFRKGAKVGDLICVTGRLGGSILGKHLNFMPRLFEGQFLARVGASSMIDLSDGLAQDLGHLASSFSFAFVVDERKIPISQAAKRLAHGDTKKALRRALCDGEDFELLFTMAPGKFRTAQKVWARRFSIPLTVIGQVIRAAKVGAGLKPALTKKHKWLGFQHF